MSLKSVLHTALVDFNYVMIELIVSQSDIYTLEPNIMELLADKLTDRVSPELEQIFESLVDRKIPMRDNCMYVLAEGGKTLLIQKVMGIYEFENLYDLTKNMCLCAIRTDQVGVIEYLIPVEWFGSVPDLVYCLLMVSIKTADNIQIVRYLTSGCVRIAQEMYAAVELAIELDRKNITEYFTNVLDAELANFD